MESALRPCSTTVLLIKEERKQVALRAEQGDRESDAYSALNLFLQDAINAGGKASWTRVTGREP